MSRKILSQALAESISGQDLGDARAYFEKELQEHEQHLAAMGNNAAEEKTAPVKLAMARALLGLGKKAQAWDEARPLLTTFVQHEQFENAVETCEILYLAEQNESIIALGHGCWMAVTYPIDPTLSVDMLSYIVEETPDDSDGAAVASVAALYLVEMRADEKQKESLSFLVKQLVALVAKRHRGIEDEESIQIWIEMLELNNLDELFTRLGKVIDAIVGSNWWIDRDDLRAKLPVN